MESIFQTLLTVLFYLAALALAVAALWVVWLLLSGQVQYSSGGLFAFIGG